VVVRYSRKASFLPHVIVAFDQNNNRLPDKQLVGPISLEENRQLRVQSCGDEDVSYIHATSSSPSDEPAEVVGVSLESLYAASFP
jgi:hypothetical protein